MNQKTAKLLRKWSTATGHTYESAKNAWVHLTHKERGEQRMKMKNDLGS